MIFRKRLIWAEQVYWLITFTVNGEEQHALYGTKFEDWITSDFNTTGVTEYYPPVYLEQTKVN